MHIKKLLLSIPAGAALLLTACSANEPVLTTNGDSVTFTAQLTGGIATRFGEGAGINQLEYAVFHGGDQSIISSNTQGAPQATKVGDKFKLTLPLLPDETYTIVFWAQNSNSQAYDFNTTDGTVKVDYSKLALNVDDHDVFFLGRQHRVGVDNTEVTLVRPLAQINIGTDDLDAALALGAEHNTTKMAVSGVHNVLDLRTGLVSKSDDFNGKVEFDEVEALPNNYPVTHPLQADGKSYKYMAMAYVLTGAEEAAATPADETPADGALLNLDLTFNYTDENRTPTLRSIPSVPVRRNHRTNIYGSLITSMTNWTISLDTGFATSEDINREVVYVDSEKDLLPILANGGSATLTADITLSTPVILNEGCEANIAIRNHTLTFNDQYSIRNSAKLTILGSDDENDHGTIDISNKGRGIYIQENANVTIDGVDIIDNVSGNGRYCLTLRGNNAKLTVKNSVLQGGSYAFTTNASELDQSGEVYFENVFVKCTHYSPMMINIPVIFTGINCTFEGESHAFLMRGGTYAFTNCLFDLRMTYDENGVCNVNKNDIPSSWRNPFRNGWRDGTYAPQGAVVMGNHYILDEIHGRFATTVDMKGCTIRVPVVAQLDELGVNYTVPAVYAYANQDEGIGVYFSFDSATQIIGQQEYSSPNIFVNGVETFNYTADFKE